MYDKVCPVCGRRLSEFIETGMLGCANCYDEFSGAVNKYVLRVQEGDTHVGKTPSVVGLNRELLSEYNMLINEKEQAGLNGDFSKMAELSEQIFILKEELIKRGLIK